MHTLLGLLELEMYDDAVEFVGEVVGDHRATAEQVTEKIHDPLLAALLVGKATVAAERGVALSVADGTLLPDRLIDPRGLVTIVGNLVDNALDAVAGTPHARVEVDLRAEGTNGDPPGTRHRARSPARAAGVDLHGGLVHQGAAGPSRARHRALPGASARRAAGRQRPGQREAAGGGAEFTVVLPDALAEQGLVTPTPAPALISTAPDDEPARQDEPTAGRDGRPGPAREPETAITAADKEPR